MATQQTTLESQVSQVKSKADDYTDRKRIEERVSTAQDKLEIYNDVLRHLNKDVEDFERTAQMLNTVLSGDPPDDVAIVRDKIRNEIDIPVAEFVRQLDDNYPELSQKTEALRELRNDVADAEDRIQDRIDEICDNWEEDINVARSIQRIVSEDSDFDDLLTQMQLFIERSVNSERKSISSLQREWEEYVEEFNKLETDWESFQERHDLSDDAIELLKDLSQDGELSLAEASPQTLTELTEVEAIRTNVALSI